jgi:hypothetical protein
MITITPKVVEMWSCHLCQKTHEDSFMLDFKRFCSYKCAFNFIWRILYGWYEFHPVTRIWIPETKTYPEVGGFKVCVKEGHDNETLKFVCEESYPNIFPKLNFDRQKWAFQLTKLKMEELKNA